jgi:peptidoglycan hydrolase-like protein with peptidoglycan-binding domain
MAIIKASDLIASIRQAYAEKWGYIWGTRGQVWTQAQQDKATRDMTVRYGQKWVGKRVADCSGLIKWAYQQHGGDIYHGSNTQYNECVETGPLAGKVRIRVGTAVFQNTSGKRGHVGIYNGGGMVIEEHGTQAGIIQSPLNTWDEWGVLKGSDLSAELWETFDIVPPDTLTKGSKGEVVKWYQRGLVELGYDIGKDKTGAPLVDGIFGSEMVSVTRAFQSDNGLEADGKAGKKTLAKLKELLEDDEPEVDTEVDFDVLVDPWDEMSLEEKVEDLHKWRLSMAKGGESNG